MAPGRGKVFQQQHRQEVVTGPILRSMTETLTILCWWAAFTASHILLSSDLIRPRLAGLLGERPFQGVYSLISFATMVPIFWVFLSNRHAGPELYSPPVPLRIMGVLLIGLALLLLGNGIVSPAPSSMMSSEMPQARGITRITRHPIAAALFLFGLGHLLEMGWAGDLAFFGGFCVFALLGTWHLDARKSAHREGYASFRNATSFFPFLAILRGKQPLGAALRELPWQGVTLGAGLFVGFYLGHGWLLGVPL